MPPAERYREAGVDLDAADHAKRRIGDLLSTTRTPLVHGRPGGFGGMIDVPAKIRHPVLVMSTDGVGTKILVAIRAARHDTVGEDLVNHCVNDILVHGASPLAFQDYIALGTIREDVVTSLVAGVARGCRAHQMALVGGETAEMPDLYPPGHYDLAGTIVGVAPRERLIHGDDVEVGDLVIGYASNGLHTNGYTLARRILFDQLGLDLDSQIPGQGTTVADALLRVHRSYATALLPVLGRVHALAHVTGGGIPGNLVRSLPPGCGAVIDRHRAPVPPLFAFLEDAGAVETGEMYRVFNMGVGMLAVAPAASADTLRAAADAAGIETWIIGDVVAGTGVRIV